MLFLYDALRRTVTRRRESADLLLEVRRRPVACAMEIGPTLFIQTTNIICKCYFFTTPYDEQLHAAEKAQTSYSKFVAGLLRAQWHERQDSALEWRIRRANLPQQIGRA